MSQVPPHRQARLSWSPARGPSNLHAFAPRRYVEKSLKWEVGRPSGARSRNARLEASWHFCRSRSSRLHPLCRKACSTPKALPGSMRFAAEFVSLWRSARTTSIGGICSRTRSYSAASTGRPGISCWRKFGRREPISGQIPARRPCFRPTGISSGHRTGPHHFSAGPEVGVAEQDQTPSLPGMSKTGGRGAQTIVDASGCIGGRPADLPGWPDQGARNAGAP